LKGTEQVLSPHGEEITAPNVEGGRSAVKQKKIQRFVRNLREAEHFSKKVDIGDLEKGKKIVSEPKEKDQSPQTKGKC